MGDKIIKAVHPAVQDDIEDLKTFRALPTHHIRHLDPFLFLNHHGPQVYPQNNMGLPFGPHPHRGFETVTFVLDGDIVHKDSAGHESIIDAGGIQWMTAGSGLIHSEESSETFKKKGGKLEILQLWLNLPARLKMTEPKYIGLQAPEIPVFMANDGKVKIHLYSGSWEQQRGAVTPLFDVTLMTLFFQGETRMTLNVPAENNVFFYVIRGNLKTNQREVKARDLIEFNPSGERILVEAKAEAIVLFGHAKPHGEPIVSHGPFVMNSKDEILQAIHDYQTGKLR